jgi:hypothetical protein
MSSIKRDGQKVYIEDVRRISWDTGEMCEFASALVSALHCLGEQVTYHYVMGTSGAAFRFTLAPGEWDFGNYSIRNLSPDPQEPMCRAIAAAGYAYTICDPGARPEDTARIVASIDQGLPVLAYQVVGPSDCCIITGYDEGGDVLLGWSTYQDIPDDHNIPHDVTGYFRKPGWQDNLHGYILLGAKKAPRPMRSVYLDALQWAVQLQRTPRLGHKLTGLAALEAWADEMTQEEYFPQGDEQVLGQRYVSTAINMTMLRDHGSAEPFLRQALTAVPEWQPELSEAADCYHTVEQLRSGMEDLINDNFSAPAMQAISDPAIRREYAARIRQICAAEQEAIAHIESLLARQSGS